mgnify:CR=1 FL=1
MLSLKDKWFSLCIVCVFICLVTASFSTFDNCHTFHRLILPLLILNLFEEGGGRSWFIRTTFRYNIYFSYSLYFFYSTPSYGTEVYKLNVTCMKCISSNKKKQLRKNYFNNFMIKLRVNKLSLKLIKHIYILHSVIISVNENLSTCRMAK